MTISLLRAALARHGSLPLAALLSSLALIAAGAAAAHGFAPFVLLGLAAAALVLSVMVRPEIALALWVAAMLASGRWVSHLQAGGLFITEIFLAVICLALAVRALSGQRAAGLPRIAVWIVAAVLIPGAASLALQTAELDLEQLRNFAIAYYTLFAVIAACVSPTIRLYRLLLAAVVAGSMIALILVFTGHAYLAGVEVTTTGARRAAHGSYSCAFAIGAIAVLAAVRHGVLSRWFLLLVPPLVAGLVVINHRSAWLAFVGAAALVLGSRAGVAVAVIGIVLALGLAGLATSKLERDAPLAAELTRARSITDFDDPNTRFRLGFWQSTLERAVASPVIGQGFDNYPPELVPTGGLADGRADPHNSFIALAYRIGLIPAVAVVVLLLALVMRGFRWARTALDPAEQAATLALTAVVVFMMIFSAFNVAFEVPYLASLAWVPVGLLAALVAKGRCQPRTEAMP